MRIWRRGAAESAIEKLRASAKLTPHFRTYEVLGECLLKRGELNEAVLMLSAAEPPVPLPLPACAPAPRRRPIRGGRENLREALAIQPTYRAARQLLDKIVNDHPEVLEYLQ